MTTHQGDYSSPRAISRLLTSRLAGILGSNSTFWSVEEAESKNKPHITVNLDLILQSGICTKVTGSVIGLHARSLSEVAQEHVASGALKIT